MFPPDAESYAEKKHSLISVLSRRFSCATISVMYRIFYKRVFSTQSEATSALREVRDIASSPFVCQGKSGAWLAVLYVHKDWERIEKGLSFYKKNGLTVYPQEFDDE